MKVIRFSQFIKEELMNDTQENYVHIALTELKHKIDRYFEQQSEEKQDPKNKSINQAKKDSKKKMTFSDLGVALESSEISKYSHEYDSLTIKFSDNIDSWYTLIIMIDLKDVKMDPAKDFKTEDIKMAFVKFKKYDTNTDDVIGQLTKNVEISKINQDFLVDLKIEIDDKFNPEEEFEIETE